MWKNKIPVVITKMAWTGARSNRSQGQTGHKGKPVKLSRHFKPTHPILKEISENFRQYKYENLANKCPGLIFDDKQLNDKKGSLVYTKDYLRLRLFTQNLAHKNYSDGRNVFYVLFNRQSHKSTITTTGEIISWEKIELSTMTTEWLLQECYRKKYSEVQIKI